MKNFMTALLVSAALGMHAQQPTYLIPDFVISPEEQTVYRIPAFGGELTLDTRINYDATELVCIARGITFKEYVEDFDLNSFKVLRYSSDPYTDILFVDKDGLYRDFYPEESGYRSMEDLSDKAMLAERVYMDKNNKTVYFVDLIGDELIELENIPAAFDFKTLKPVCDNFFFNKDGLYVFGHTLSESPYHVDDSSVNLLKKSNGKQIVPEVYKYYFVYDGDVYARNQGDVVKKLELNPTKIKDLSRIIYPEFLSDGTTSYSRFYKTGSEGLEKLAYWKTVAERGECSFVADKSTGRLFMPSSVSVPVNGMELIESALVWDGEKYLSIDCERNMKTFKSLYVYNHKTQKHEELDWKKYKRICAGLYAYDGILVREGAKVKGQEVLDINNLRPLSLDKNRAVFFTDEKHIYCMDHNDTILKDVDMKSLRVINNKLMVDKNRVYSHHIMELTVIPYRQMGWNIKVVDELN